MADRMLSDEIKQRYADSNRPAPIAAHAYWERS